MSTEVSALRRAAFQKVPTPVWQQVEEGYQEFERRVGEEYNSWNEGCQYQYGRRPGCPSFPWALNDPEFREKTPVDCVERLLIKANLCEDLDLFQALIETASFPHVSLRRVLDSIPIEKTRAELFFNLMRKEETKVRLREICTSEELVSYIRWLLDFLGVRFTAPNSRQEEFRPLLFEVMQFPAFQSFSAKDLGKTLMEMATKSSTTPIEAFQMLKDHPRYGEISQEDLGKALDRFLANIYTMPDFSPIPSIPTIEAMKLFRDRFLELRGEYLGKPLETASRDVVPSHPESRETFEMLVNHPHFEEIDPKHLGKAFENIILYESHRPLFEIIQRHPTFLSKISPEDLSKVLKSVSDPDYGLDKKTQNLVFKIFISILEKRSSGDICKVLISLESFNPINLKRFDEEGIFLSGLLDNPNVEISGKDLGEVLEKYSLDGEWIKILLKSPRSLSIPSEYFPLAIKRINDSTGSQWRKEEKELIKSHPNYPANSPCCSLM